MTVQTITLTVNGNSVAQAAEPRTHLADFLREDLLLTGTHLGCEQGVCGACTVFVDGRPSRACITLAASCQGAHVQTIEGFDDDPLMAKLRDAFKRHHGLQCGYCTPGMLATGYDIVRRLPDADTDRIRRELAGNICRCTGYAGIVEAISDVLGNTPPSANVQPQTRERTGAAGKADIALASSAPLPSESVVRDSEDANLPGMEAFANAPTLSRQLSIAAPLEDVWRILSTPNEIVACIPGAALDANPEKDLLQGTCVVAMGPIKAAFRGIARLTFEPASRSGHVVGRGRDSFTRSVLEGRLNFAVAEVSAHATELTLDMAYTLTGPLSQFSRPDLVAEIADDLLRQVAKGIETRAAGGVAAPASHSSLNGFSLVWRIVKRRVKRLFS
ncbi:MAG: 2Fe-2S iron-sulfur cluster-binding protein [Alphaproteobacteria bacterium]|nr:2Fe-2S iron-sulfur cluster-binding protein [Alphaproteobacteria bacterium]